MPPASTASFTTSTALRICRHCLAEAQVDVALENFPHHAGCPRIEDFGAPVRAGLEQLADEMQPLFANSYGSPPVLPRQAEGFVSCGNCPDLPGCARRRRCERDVGTTEEPGGYDEDDGAVPPLQAANDFAFDPAWHLRPSDEFRLAEKLRRIDEKFKADHPWLADRRRHWCRFCGESAPEGAILEHAPACPAHLDNCSPATGRPAWLIDFDPETLTARPPAAIDPRRRTAPHGDPHLVDFGFVDGEPEPKAKIFEIHPHQQRFIDLMEHGGRPVLTQQRRSPSWPEAFRIVEGLWKEARAPWRRDAEAAENGMGC